MMPFALAPAPHADILEVLVSFTILLVTARVLGGLATRIGQSSVVGELLAGVLLGPSLLARLWPPVTEWFVPRSATGGHLLELLGMLGAIFLLVITGIETDLPLIRRNARVAAGVALGGLVLPFGLGYLVAGFVPSDLIANPDRPVVFGLFLATALAVSAIPVIAKVLLDLGLIRRQFGQTVLAAGMIDDSLAWILLSVVLSLATEDVTSPATIALAAGRIVVFLLLSFTVGRWIVDRLLIAVQDRGRAPDGLFTLVVASALAFGAVAHALGIEAVLGAFVAGIIFGQNPRLPVGVIDRLHTLALAVFAPVFFAIAGVKVDVGLLSDPRLLGLTALIFAVAVVGKTMGAFLAARMSGVDAWTALAYGSALNARGAVGIIIASIGLELEILSPEVYSMIVLTSILTSVMASPFVRLFLRRVPPNADEDRRIERESAGSVGGFTPRRILIPFRVRDDVAPVHHVVADLVGSIAGSAAVTLLTVASKEDRAKAERFLSEVAALFSVRPTRRVLVGEDPIESILESARAGHDLLVLGATESTSTDQVLFNPVVDAVTRMAPCPTLIVTGRNLDSISWPPARILVPTDGTGASQGAARLAFSIARGAMVSVVHVIQDSPYVRTGPSEALVERRMRQAQEIVDDLARLSAPYDVTVERHVMTGPLLSETIIEAVVDQGIDLVVMGTNLRPGSTRLHFGPQLEAVLQTTPCPVLLINMP